MPTEAANAEKKSVALSSVLASFLLLLFKCVVGFQTGSLGILSEALHSGLDLVAALITVMAVILASRPPDRDHHYGHGKVENFSALVETLLLIGTCYWIVSEAFSRLTGASVHRIEPSIWAYAVMIVSIVVDYNRSRALMNAAEKYSSQALEADAIHFSSDIYSSAVVIVGLAATQAGRVLGLPWLEAADPIAAVVVALIVLVVSLRLGMRTVDALVDRAPESVIPLLEAAAVRVADVRGCDRIRVRTSGSHTFVELTIAVDRTVPLERTQIIAQEVRQAVASICTDADVVVQIQTRDNPNETLEQKVRKAADGLNLSVHNIGVHHSKIETFLDLHLEVDSDLPLKAAHDLANGLEARIRLEAPDLKDVLIRIEGRRSDSWNQRLPAEEEQKLTGQLIALGRSVPSVVDCRDLVIVSGPHNVSISCRCLFPDDMPVERVNSLAHQIERLWRRADHRIDRVTIHQEPVGSSAQPDRGVP